MNEKLTIREAREVARSIQDRAEARQVAFDNATMNDPCHQEDAQIDKALGQDWPAKQPRIYPCVKCGALRTKDEGGEVFTVCDDCWDKLPRL